MWVFYLPYLISIKKISIFFKRRVQVYISSSRNDFLNRVGRDKYKMAALFY